MKFRMSRRLAFVEADLERLARRGVQQRLRLRAGLARASARSPGAGATPRCGRESSSRARPTRAAASRLVASSSSALLVLDAAPRRADRCSSNSCALSRCARATRSASRARARSCTPRLSGSSCTASRVVGDRRSEVAGARRPPAPCGTPGRRRTPRRIDARARSRLHQPVLQHRHSISTPARPGLTCRRIPGRTGGSSRVRGRRAYSITTDSTPMRTRRYRPSMISPSRP